MNMLVLVMGNALVRLTYGVAAVLAPSRPFAGKVPLAPDTDRFPEARLFVRGFSSHQVAARSSKRADKRSSTEVEPYPVQLGSRYRDGKPDEHGKSWLGVVTGFQPPGSLDFHHTIDVSQLRAMVDVHIHYSFEPQDGGTRVERWLILDVAMPSVLRPLRRLIISPFDKENVRTIAAVKSFAETHHGTGRDAVSEAPGV